MVSEVSVLESSVPEAGASGEDCSVWVFCDAGGVDDWAETRRGAMAHTSREQKIRSASWARARKAFYLN
jgi:hypothetical protein